MVRLLVETTEDVEAFYETVAISSRKGGTCIRSNTFIVVQYGIESGTKSPLPEFDFPSQLFSFGPPPKRGDLDTQDRSLPMFQRLETYSR